MNGIQHSAFSAQRPATGNIQGIRHSAPNGEGSRRKFYLQNLEKRIFCLAATRLGMVLPLLFVPFLLYAQVPLRLPPGGLIQLQVQQPKVDLSEPVTATATFDPPAVRAGEKTFYRVTVDATEASIQWPDEIAAPSELKFSPGARGQMMELQGNHYQPVTAFTYEVRATATGRFTVSNFVVNAYDRPVEIPAAAVNIVAANSAPQPAARELGLEISATNIFLGQPVRVRVLQPETQGNQIESLIEVAINGDGLMTDKTAMRQSIEVVKRDGQLKPAFIFETTVTPIATGHLEISAQAFTSGHEFGGPISINGRATLSSGPPDYTFLVSEPLELKVRPLPTADELPGFTGAMGNFIADTPHLSTNRIHMGEPVQLKATFHGVGNLTRFVPPEAPLSRDWQIIADNPPEAGFTLIPLTDEVQATPAIPFCSFDPVTGQYVDLSIPPLPITVIGEGLPTQLPVPDETERVSAPTELSTLAPTPGKRVASLKPLQLRGWFVGLQLVPVLGFIALWQWDRRRRFLEAHPEIVRRRHAKRRLRRERIKLQAAVSAGNTGGFILHAADAMKIACAPHFPAHPQALVCGDVLSQLDDTDQGGLAGRTVRKIFCAADSQFAGTFQTPADLLALHPDVESVLNELEEKL